MDNCIINLKVSSLRHQFWPFFKIFNESNCVSNPVSLQDNNNSNNKFDSYVKYMSCRSIKIDILL